MKRIFILVLIFILIFSFVGCTAKKKISSVSSEVVEATIIDAYRLYSSSFYIEVAYEDNEMRWYGREYYNKFSKSIGFHVRCILMTYTYKDGSVKKELIYNEDIYNGGELK